MHKLKSRDYPLPGDNGINCLSDPVNNKYKQNPNDGSSNKNAVQLFHGHFKTIGEE